MFATLPCAVINLKPFKSNAGVAVPLASGVLGVLDAADAPVDPPPPPHDAKDRQAITMPAADIDSEIFRAELESFIGTFNG